MAQQCGTLPMLFLVLLCNVTLRLASADWTLVVAHSNDLWFQLDEIQADNTMCYRDLPVTTTPIPTSTPTTTSEATTPTTTPTTTTSTTQSTTIPTTTTQPTQPTTPTPANTTESTEPTEKLLETNKSNETASPQNFRAKRMLGDPAGALLVPDNSAFKRKLRQVDSSFIQHLDSRAVDASLPHSTDKANLSMPTVAQLVNSTLLNSADVAKSTVPPDTVNSTVVYFADKVNSSVPYFGDVVNGSVPHFADKVNSTVPYFADIVNSTVPHFADVEASTTQAPTSTTGCTFRPPKEPCYGGVARHLTKAQQIRAESDKAGKVFLHLNAGGMLGGNIWWPILGPKPAAESIQMLNYDALALGYRDFDEGISSTVDYLNELKKLDVPVLCANIDAADEPAMKGLFQSSVIFDINGHKIGIVGYIGQDAEYIADTGKLKFEDEKTAINREVNYLFSKGVGYIIALGNAGYDRGKALLNSTLNVDLIINGGGASVFQYNGPKGPLGEKVIDPYPAVWEKTDYSKRLLVTTSRYGKYLGKLEMTVSDEGNIRAVNPASTPVLLDPSVEPELELQAKVDDWEREVLTKSNETIGYTKVPIQSDRKVCWYDECTGASLMADAARWFLETNQTSNSPWSDSISATVWHGGALSNTDLGVAAGPITFGDILYMFPYANTLAMAKMKGSEIKLLFEKSVEFYNETNSVNPNLGEFLHVSGMRVEYDLKKEKLARVSSILIRDTTDPAGGYSPLRLNGTYRIGMPSFIARGGSRYDFMNSIEHDDTGIRDEVALRAFIGWTSPLAYGNDGRLRFVIPDEPLSCAHVDVTGTVFLTIFLTLLFSGMIFAAYRYLYPKLRDRRGSLLSLIR